MSLLPNNASQLEKAIDGLIAQKLAIDLSVVNNNPLMCPSVLLPWLAAQWRVDIAGLAEHEQRTLIANAFEIHRYKGTVYAVQKSLDAVFNDATLIEDNAAFEFDARVTIKPNPASVYDSSKFNVARQLVNKAKNARSRFVNFIIDMPDAAGNTGKTDAGLFGVRFSSSLNFNANAPTNIQGAIRWKL